MKTSPRMDQWEVRDAVLRFRATSLPLVSDPISHHVLSSSRPRRWVRAAIPLFGPTTSSKSGTDGDSHAPRPFRPPLCGRRCNPTRFPSLGAASHARGAVVV